MKRQIYQSLIEWKQAKSRKPLILQGARQVGKTFALETFAKEHYQNAIRLNFEVDPQLKQFFIQDLKPKRIISEIEIYFATDIIPAKTLLIFDEIQECPQALNSLKYFNEQASEYHVCAAGSLLGVALANNKGFPVGQVNFLHLYPVSFMEFLDAVGEQKLKTYIQTVTTLEPLPEALHNKLIQWLKLYLYIGGMPEVVKTYIATQDLQAVRKVQQEIINAYYLDFSKHTTSANMLKISQVWDSIPSQLAKENKKFIYSLVRQTARAREYEEALQWLVQAGVVYKIFNVKAPKSPLSAYADLSIFKLYLVDVGLLGALAKLKATVTVAGDQLFQEFKGSLTENFVAQELIGQQEQLHYWTSEGTAEVDYVLELQQGIFPLEVKAGISAKKRSLLVYADKYTPQCALRTSLNNLKNNGAILNIPLYLISEVERLLSII